MNYEAMNYDFVNSCVNYYYLCFIAFKTCIGNTKFITLTIFTCKVQKNVKYIHIMQQIYTT